MKSSHLQIRISDTQKKALQQASSLANMDVSSWVLSKLFGEPRTRFLEILGKIPDGEHQFALAELGDFFKELNAEQLSEVLRAPWGTSLEPMLANYVAAMLEVCAHEKKIESPRWLREIEPLEKPYFGSDFQSLRFYLLQVSPPPFKARNIFIDTTFMGRV